MASGFQLYRLNEGADLVEFVLPASQILKAVQVSKASCSEIGKMVVLELYGGNWCKEGKKPASVCNLIFV